MNVCVCACVPNLAPFISFCLIFLHLHSLFLSKLRTMRFFCFWTRKKPAQQCADWCFEYYQSREIHKPAHMFASSFGIVVALEQNQTKVSNTAIHDMFTGVIVSINFAFVTCYTYISSSMCSIKWKLQFRNARTLHLPTILSISNLFDVHWNCTVTHCCAHNNRWKQTNKRASK